MKIILLLIPLLILSCSTRKSSKSNDAAIASDTTSVLYSGDSDGDGLVDKDALLLENNSDYVVGSAGPSVAEIVIQPNTKAPIKMPMKVSDLRDSKKMTKKGFGTVAYNIPDKLEVNKYYTIKLRISSKNSDIQSLIIGDRRIPITINGDEVTIENIKIDSIMSAKLFADSKAFEIELASLSDQRIEDDGYTEWVWRIRPLKSGDSYLKLLITISGKDIVVYEKNIPVESNWKWSFTNWVKTWWQIIASTLLIPIAIPVFKWWFARKKKDEEDKEDKA